MQRLSQSDKTFNSGSVEVWIGMFEMQSEEWFRRCKRLRLGWVLLRMQVYPSDPRGVRIGRSLNKDGWDW